jgi:hypothetical protein
VAENQPSWWSKPIPPSPQQTANRIYPNGQATGRYGLAALEDECHKVSQERHGNRNNQLNQSAFRIAQLIGSGQVDQRVAWDRLYSAAKSCGLEDREITDVIKRAMEAGVQQPRQPEMRAGSAPGWNGQYTANNASGGQDAGASGSSGAGGDLKIIDAAELAANSKDLQISYLPLLGQNGFFVRGWSHLLAGYPRMGKTELMAILCREWLALGETILYFTEESEHIWGLRLKRHAPEAWRGMKIVPALGGSPLEMFVMAQRAEQSVIILDAVRNLGLSGPDENDNSSVARHMSPWTKMARDKGKTLSALHHDRKGGGQHGEGIAGGHAFMGLFDIALEVTYNARNRRQVQNYPRIIELRKLIYERQPDGSMRALGDPEELGLATVRERVIEALANVEHTDGWLKTDQIIESLGDPKPSDEQVRKALKAEAEARQPKIERDPSIHAESSQGGRGHKWRLIVEGRSGELFS